MRWILPVLAALAPAAVRAQARTVDSVVPALAFGSRCSSNITLANLSDREVVVDLEAHRPGGALAPLAGHAGMTFRLAPGERSNLKPQIDEETEGAWVKVRERVPARDLSPALSVSGVTECVISNQLKTAAREVVYPTRNPWFDGDVTDLKGDLISLINTGEQPATASLCYSSGSLFSTPEARQLQPVCSSADEIRIPPFGSREFPVARAGSSYFSLKTQGPAIVLEMLRPLGESIKMYTVDSTIRFGGEVTGKQ